MNAYLGRHLHMIIFAFLGVFAMLKLRIEQMISLLLGVESVFLWDIRLAKKDGSYMI